MNTITEQKLESLLELHELISNKDYTVGFSANHEVRLTVIAPDGQVRMIQKDQYHLLTATVVPSFIGSKMLKRAVLNSLRREIKATLTYSAKLKKRALAIINGKG